jgi:uncharacterized RDD family membrane protein YckC
MAFCAHCGRELPAGAVFCPSCGTAVAPQQRQETELDRLTKDSETQEYWLRRVFAFVIDLLVVSVIEFFIAAVVFFPIFLATGIFFPLASLGFFLNLLSPLSLLLSGFTALVLLVYFTVAETAYRKTFGKALLGLVVVTTDGSPLSIGRAFVRNLSKIYWLLLLLDLVAGFITPLSAGQKFSDHLVSTNVSRSAREASSVEGGPQKSVSR